MTKVITKEFLMERRTFLKWSAAAAVAGSVIDIDAAFAAGECKAVGDISSAANSVLTKTPSNASQELLYWIDGPMNAGLPGYSGGLQTRARLSCTMNMLHTAASFIESVSLVEDPAGSKTLIAQTFYGPSAGTTKGRAPYTVFENLDLDYSKNYQILYVKNVGGMITVYQHTIVQPEPSRFDYNHALGDQDESFMPDLVGELRKTNLYHFKDKATKKTGYVTTPFGATTEGPHTARAHIKKIETSGPNKGDFEIEIDFMHDDSDSDAHYMRYFLVLDPVGRVLGGVRRIYGDGVTGKVLVKRGFHTPRHPDPAKSPALLVKKYEYDSKEYLELHGKKITNSTNPPSLVDIQLLNATQKIQYIDSLSILDCPFISIYTDDRFHAIARFSIRLR
jgi:hypothetical protein